MEHIVIYHLRPTSMPINQNHKKDGYPATQKEGHETGLLLEKQMGNSWILLSQISLDRMIHFD
jgi:hypothetical protein